MSIPISINYNLALKLVITLYKESFLLKPDLSTNLRKLLTLANISEHELSRRTGIKQPIIHRLLSGENKNPTISTLKPLADYFTVSTSQLIGEQDIENSWSGFTSHKHQGWKEIPLINWDQVATSQDNREFSKVISVDCNVGNEAFALLIKDSKHGTSFP